MKIEDAIACAQAEYLHRNVVPAVVASLLGACAIVIGFRDTVPATSLFLWLVAQAAFMTSRIVTWWQFRRVDFTPAVARRFFRNALTGTLANSILWAIGMVLFFPSGTLTQQLLFNFALLTLSVGAMFSQGSYYPSYVTYLLPFSLTALFVMSTQHAALPAFLLGTCVFIPFTLLFAWRVNRLLVKSLQLRFENMELVEQLTAQKAVAEKATLAKSRFLAAASHDLRQPMHALNLYLGALSNPALPTSADAILAKARHCAETMDDMFRALLDISRLDASAMRAEVHSFPLAGLLERIEIEFEPQARAKGLTLRVAHCSAFVRSDPVLLERILRNLVTNAVRYTERGRILVGCRRTAGGIRLVVHDTGPGIAPRHQQAIFEEFYQIADSERNQSQGMGLGLAIVQRLALLLGTTVHLASEPGRGSTFTIALPIAVATDAPAPQITPPANPGNLSGALILVVDDEAAIRDAAQALLESWGCDVVTAASGGEAMAQLGVSAQVPDVLVCDYRLHSGETGGDVIAALREEFNADIPALLITGETASEGLRDTPVGDLLVLHKPLQDHVLRQALAQLVAAGQTVRA